jgi:hypothetical protein
VQVSEDGKDWVTVVSRTSLAQRVQRTEFTGLGRYVRIIGKHRGGPLKPASVKVLGTS